MINIVLQIPNPDDATAFYRATGPFSRLRMQMDNVACMFIQEWKYATICWADVCFMQRPWAPQHVQIAQMVKDIGKPLWIDYDDDLFSVPTDNPVHDIYRIEATRKQIATICALADIITVSTPTLRNKLLPLNKNIRVVPNALDDSLRVVKNRSINNGPREKIVFWRGTNTHQRDLMSVAGEMIDVAAAKKDWTFQFLGYNPFFITDQMGEQQAVVYRGLDILAYLDFIHKRQCPIQVVPLVDSPFNRSKSNIAWLEATLAGSMTIAPKIPEFERPGVFTYETPEEFKDKLSRMIDGEFELASTVRESWAFIEKNCTLKTVNDLRKEIVLELAESGRG